MLGLDTTGEVPTERSQSSEDQAARLAKKKEKKAERKARGKEKKKEKNKELRRKRRQEEGEQRKEEWRKKKEEREEKRKMDEEERRRGERTSFRGVPRSPRSGFQGRYNPPQVRHSSGGWGPSRPSQFASPYEGSQPPRATSPFGRLPPPQSTHSFGGYAPPQTTHPFGGLSPSNLRQGGAGGQSHPPAQPTEGQARPTAKPEVPVKTTGSAPAGGRIEKKKGKKDAERKAKERAKKKREEEEERERKAEERERRTEEMTSNIASLVAGLTQVQQRQAEESRTERRERQIREEIDSEAVAMRGRWEGDLQGYLRQSEAARPRGEDAAFEQWERLIGIARQMLQYVNTAQQQMWRRSRDLPDPSRAGRELRDQLELESNNASGRIELTRNSIEFRAGVAPAPVRRQALAPPPPRRLLEDVEMEGVEEAVGEMVRRSAGREARGRDSRGGITFNVNMNIFGAASVPPTMPPGYASRDEGRMEVDHPWDSQGQLPARQQPGTILRPVATEAGDATAAGLLSSGTQAPSNGPVAGLLGYNDQAASQGQEIVQQVAQAPLVDDNGNPHDIQGYLVDQLGNRIRDRATGRYTVGNFESRMS